MKHLLSHITAIAAAALILCSCGGPKLATANKQLKRGGHSETEKIYSDSTILSLGKNLSAAGKYQEAIALYEAHLQYLASVNANSSDETAGKESKNEPLHVMKTPQNNGGHFAWGADLGSSIDMTGNAMTSLNIGACFGYRNNWFRMLGLGAEINTMMSNSSRSIPIYGIVQTSFSNYPQLCFLDLRGGLSMNNYENQNTQTGGYGALGIGITLAHSSKFASHFILGYTFIQRKDFSTDEGLYQLENLQMATLRIGICF